MNLNPLILANIQNSPYFKVIPSRSGLRNLMILNFLRPSCLRCGHFTRWWTRSITRWITSSPGRRVPARLLAAAPPGCAEAWEVCPRGASRPPHFASSTNSTPSNWPKSRSAVKILKILRRYIKYQGESEVYSSKPNVKFFNSIIRLFSNFFNFRISLCSDKKGGRPQALDHVN